jgi:hypothetical protein
MDMESHGRKDEHLSSAGHHPTPAHGIRRADTSVTPSSCKRLGSKSNRNPAQARCEGEALTRAESSAPAAASRARTSPSEAPPHEARHPPKTPPPSLPPGRRLPHVHYHYWPRATGPANSAKRGRCPALLALVSSSPRLQLHSHLKTKLLRAL